IWFHNAYDTFTDTFSFVFWQPSDRDPRSPEGTSVVRVRPLVNLTALLNRIEAPLLTAVYLLMLGLALYSPVALWRADRDATLRALTVSTFALSTLAVLVAYAVLAAYYNRYSVPQMGVLFLSATYVIDHVVSWRQSHR